MYAGVCKEVGGCLLLPNLPEPLGPELKPAVRSNSLSMLVELTRPSDLGGWTPDKPITATVAPGRPPAAFDARNRSGHAAIKIHPLGNPFSLERAGLVSTVLAAPAVYGRCRRPAP